jgi:preprotein translocase subunit SecG
MTILYYTAIGLFGFLCLIICLTILIQESKSLGLGASFGGDPGESLFGTSTADVLKKFTAWLISIFMIACLLLSLWTSAIGRKRAEPMAPTTLEQSDNP